MPLGTALSLLLVALTGLVAHTWTGPATGAWPPGSLPAGPQGSSTAVGRTAGPAAILSLAHVSLVHAAVTPSGATEHAARHAVVQLRRLDTVTGTTADGPARVARESGLDWKPIVRNERTPARVGQRQPRTLQLPLLLAVLLLILLGLLAVGLERLLPPRLSTAAHTAAGLFSRAPPLHTA
jgi:hypothetical protein